VLLSKALEGLILSKSAEGKSPHTLLVYRYGVNKLISLSGDRELDQITRQDMEAFFTHLRKSELSEASIANVWRGIRVLYKWAEKEFNCPRPEKDLPRPFAPANHIQPFTEQECKAILGACGYSSSARVKDRKSFTMRRPTAERDRAIVLTLLDTGIRAGELTRIKTADVDIHTGEIRIMPYRSGLKSRGRSVYLANASRSHVWRYTQRNPGNVYLFQSGSRPMNRDSLYKLLRRLGQRSGVKNVHPHRFRHTFAIQYLRNGGDIYTLQMLLGHASWKMVRHYLELAQSDCELAHKRASPVENWNLR